MSDIAAVPRNPGLTRRRILEAAFQEIHHRGFQGTRLDDVLSATGLTKGALYHHFPNKQALGYAVVEEVLTEQLQARWVQPLREANDPMKTMIYIIGNLHEIAGASICTLGCPLNNLAQEMSPLDEGFRRRLDNVYLSWLQAVEYSLEWGKQHNQVRSDVDIHETATLLLAAIEGCIGMAKNAQSPQRLKTCSTGMIGYLESLTPRSLQ